ncbi:MAG: oligosaccharide flippase family protein, partial [Bacilli bacterium]|nr:oligosaccharide flippase family protein [Bacilli bacterium]
YEQSEKIVKMAMTFITSIGTVMIPRNTNEIAKGNIGKVKANVITSSRLVWLIGIPMMLGLIVVSRNFVPWFFGEGYDKCSTLMMIFSPLVLFIGFSNVFGLQYMIPMGYDKKFTASLITGSLINIILNCIFIPIWWSIGAAIASIIAELFVTLMMIFILRKEIDFKAIIKSSIKYLIAGTIMFSVALTISYLVPSSIWFTLLLISVGMAVYVLSLILLKEKYTKIFIHKIFGKSL